MTADDVRAIFEVYACYLANPQADPEAQPELRFDQDVGALLMAQRDLIVALARQLDGAVVLEGDLIHRSVWEHILRSGLDRLEARVWRSITPDGSGCVQPPQTRQRGS